MKKKVNLDDKDVVFIDKPWTEEERKNFSAYLKARKLHLRQRKYTRTFTTLTKKHYV